MQLVSMKMSKEEAKEYSGGASLAKDVPEYPYGLRLDLDDDALEKLGITGLPEVGKSLQMLAIVEVCNVSSYKSFDGENEKRVCFQITDMGLGSVPSDKETSEKLYNGG